MGLIRLLLGTKVLVTERQSKEPVLFSRWCDICLRGRGGGGWAVGEEVATSPSLRLVH